MRRATGISPQRYLTKHVKFKVLSLIIWKTGELYKGLLELKLLLRLWPYTWGGTGKFYLNIRFLKYRFALDLGNKCQAMGRE
jgi:hypothetical protein